MTLKTLIPYIVIVVLLLFLWQGGCERETKVIKVPEVVREFDTITEIKYLKSDTVYITRWNEIEIPTPNPVNKTLVENFQQAQDSIQRLNLYLQAIQERHFAETFEDEFAQINVSGKVRGELLDLTSNYRIKPRDIEVKTGSRLRLLGGFNIGNTKELSGFRWKASLGLQNGQGNIFRLGYGDGETFWLGYETSLISF